LYEVPSTHRGGQAKYKEPRAKKQEDLLQIGIDYNFFAPAYRRQVLASLRENRKNPPRRTRNSAGQVFARRKIRRGGYLVHCTFFCTAKILKSAQQKLLNLHNKNFNVDLNNQMTVLCRI
jgi:hypothetical protein